VRKTFTVKLQELPRPTAVAGRDGEEAESVDDASGAASLGRLGVTVAPVTENDAARFQLGRDQRGVLVTEVRPGGPAWNELVDGDRGGPDVILEVEGKPVKSPAELRKALEGMKPGDIVSLRVYNTQAKNRRVERIRLGE
jgi:serine protease Do